MGHLTAEYLYNRFLFIKGERDAASVGPSD